MNTSKATRRTRASVCFVPRWRRPQSIWCHDELTCCHASPSDRGHLFISSLRVTWPSCWVSGLSHHINLIQGHAAYSPTSTSISQTLTNISHTATVFYQDARAAPSRIWNAVQDAGNNWMNLVLSYLCLAKLARRVPQVCVICHADAISVVPGLGFCGYVIYSSNW